MGGDDAGRTRADPRPPASPAGTAWTRRSRKRQSAVLSQLDQYAATLEVRVQELLKALDVIAARSGG